MGSRLFGSVVLAWAALTWSARANPADLSSAFRSGPVEAVRAALAAEGNPDERPGAGTAWGSVSTPSDALAPFVLSDSASGIRLEVSLRGALPARGAHVDGLTLYRGAHRSGADLVHRVVARGLEDYWYFREPPPSAEVSYDVVLRDAAASLTWSGLVLQLVDASGVARIAIEAPYLIDSFGRRHTTRMRVDDCAVAVDGASARSHEVLRPGRACILRVGWDGGAVRYPAVLDPSWQTLTDAPTQGRHLHTTTRVNGGIASFGEVVVAGGRSCATSEPSSCVDLASASQIHWKNDEWGLFGVVTLPSMSVARSGHAAAPVLTQLLVSGGTTSSAGTSTELYQPLLKLWKTVAPMHHSRAFHTLTPLFLKSWVLAAGGYNGCNGAPCGPVAIAEFYDPESETWSTVQPMIEPRYRHTATQLRAPTAFVLVAGGINAAGDSTASAELYNPVFFDWEVTGSMLEARSGHTAHLVHVDGELRVLVAGGQKCLAGACTPLASAELYDPAAGTWSATGSMSVARAEHESVALPSCQVLAAGGTTSGSALATAELYDQVTGTWFPTVALTEPRRGASAATRLDGSVVFVGGLGSASVPLASGEVFSPCGVSCSTQIASCHCPQCVDTDYDGLSDAWETTGVDTDCDGIVDLDLASQGANPNHKDVFLELDYMQGGTPTHSHAPDPLVVPKIVQAFASAPVTNPDGTTGITLHVDVDDALPHADTINFKPKPDCSSVTLDILKALYFDERRRPAFHYGVFAHFTECIGSWNGIAELGGDDLIIGAGVLVSNGTAQAGVLMHELGHNLNLDHNAPMAPNYVSVMNSLFHFGIPPTQRIDYSRELLPSLNEAALDESQGIQDGTDQTKRYCTSGGPLLVESGSGPIDWDCDNVIDATLVQKDIDLNGSTATLSGRNDWAENYLLYPPGSSPLPNESIGNLNFNFQCGSAHTTAGAQQEHPRELSVDEQRALHLLYPVLPVEIDLWPLCDDRRIVIGSLLPVPVTVFGSRSLDVSAIDPATLEFASARAQKAAFVDLNRDGQRDLLALFRTRDLVVSTASTNARLTGSLRSSQSIQGEAVIRVVDGRTRGLLPDGLLRRRCEIASTLY